MAKRKKDKPADHLEIIYVEPRTLNPSKYNPRKIKPTEFNKLRRSIREYGFVEPIVVRTDGNQIIGGHQRLRAAIAEGLRKVPVVFQDISDARAKALNLALNRIKGDWSMPMLREVLAELEGIDKVDLGLTGFDRREIEDMIADVRKGEIEELDLRPPPKLIWILTGIPINAYGSVREHIAALEKEAEIVVQSTRD